MELRTVDFGAMNLVSSLVISGISSLVLRLGHDYPKVRIPIFVRSFFVD